MRADFKQKLRVEQSISLSGSMKGQGKIPTLKEEHYRILSFDLDGDAPKQFIQAYLFERDSTIYKNDPTTWKYYIAKTAEKWYPHESVVEYLINKIGDVLGLKMNVAKLVYANTQIRFLSEYFINRTKEVMIHGAEIYGEYLQDEEFAKQVANDKESARELFSFEFILEAIKSVFPHHCNNLCDDLVKLIVYDAIVGNNARHFYNWAVIRPLRKGEADPYFSPIYDSSRALMWSWSDRDKKGISRTMLTAERKL